MPLEIRELVIKLTVEEPGKKREADPQLMRELENRLERLDEKIISLTETIENMYAR